MIEKIAFIGGDLRMPQAASYAKKNKIRVSLYGFDKYEYCWECFGIEQETELDTALLGSDAVVLGLPFSSDNKFIYSPYSSQEIHIDDIFSLLKGREIIFCGKASKELIEKALKQNIEVYDYFLREELTIKNAMITAEGAIQTAMSETAFTINGSKCLVMGYGRIGKMLSNLLQKLGADVTCSARKESDLALIECNGLKPIRTIELNDELTDFDIIFNTIPNCILTYDKLSKIRCDTTIIDLASKPGGVDFSGAKKLGLKAIWATSLPGKVAPITSGKIISDTIFNIIREIGR